MFLFWLLYIYHHKLVNHIIQYFFKSPTLVQMAFCFSDSLSSTIRKEFNINYLNTQLSTQDCPFVLTSFEMAILSTSTSQTFIVFFTKKKHLLLLSSHQISTLLYYFSKLIRTFFYKYVMKTDSMSIITLFKVNIFSRGKESYELIINFCIIMRKRYAIPLF